MKRRAIKFQYDREADAAYLKLTSGKVLESEEVEPGVVVDFGADEKIIGIEILSFSRRFMSKSSIAAGSNNRSKPLQKSA
jgi:uncharacterized protein YuzE